MFNIIKSISKIKTNETERLEQVHILVPSLSETGRG